MPATSPVVQNVRRKPCGLIGRDEFVDRRQAVVQGVQAARPGRCMLSLRTPARDPLGDQPRAGGGYSTARLRKRSSSDTGRRVPAASSSDTTSCVRRSSRSASTNAISATIAVARRSWRARRPWTSSARHLIIRTGEFALAVAVRRGGWHEHRELAENRPGAERREDPAVFEDLDTSFEDGCDAVCWVALFEERRAGCRVAHRDLSVELVHVLVNDESKRAHGSNRCWSLRIQARSP